MKYIANPVEADAWVIEKIYDGPITNPKDAMAVCLIGRPEAPIVGLSYAMISRHVPVAGDYYVIQSDGYVYINPKEVFEHKYSPAVDEPIIVAFGTKLEPNGDITRVRITKSETVLVLTYEQAVSLVNKIDGRA